MGCSLNCSQLERVGVSRSSWFRDKCLHGHGNGGSDGSISKFGASRYIGGLSPWLERCRQYSRAYGCRKVGSSMAAEIGTMKVTEQLTPQGLWAGQYVFVGLPRILASLLMVPILTIYSMVVGTLGGYFYIVVRGVHSLVFKDSIRLLVGTYISSGLIKSVVFGFVVSIVACACGLERKDQGRWRDGPGCRMSNMLIWY